jgi:hypothetical protein
MPWSVNQPNAQVLAVHAALMPTGHILYFGGDEHNQQQHETRNIDHTCLFDCETARCRPLSAACHRPQKAWPQQKVSVVGEPMPTPTSGI